MAGGNVGIGTDSPDLKLDVTHATAAEYIATFQNSGNNNQLKIGNQAQGYLNIQGARIDNGNSYNMSLQADGGNVGIGTAIPSEKLHVYGGNVLIEGGNVTTTVSELGFTNAYDTAFLRSKYTNPSASTETYLAFHANTAGAANGTVAEQRRIKGNKVGIGTSVAPAQKLTVTGVSGANVGGLTNGILALTTGTGAIADTRLLFGIVDDSYAWLQAADHGVAYRDISLNPNGGKVGIGSATNPTDLFYITGKATSTAMGIKIGTNGYNGIEFDNATGSLVGRITINSGTTAYVTSSDYRLKENVADMTGATTRLKQLKPKRFNWIADDTNTLIDGFLAHEVSGVVPEAVAGEKDAVHPEGHHEAGEIDPQGIDHSKLVPLLVKTIQELEARITILEA